MKKTWPDYLRKMLTVFVIAVMLLQTVPAMAGNSQAQNTLLSDEDAYEVNPWSDWTMEGGIYYLVNKKSGLVLDVKGGTDHSEPKAAVQLYEKTDGNNPSQHFRISWTGNGWTVTLRTGRAMLSALSCRPMTQSWNIQSQTP